MCEYHVDMCDLIQKLNINDDSIVLDNKIREIVNDYKSDVLEDEDTLKKAFNIFNDKALDDSNFAVNLALIFSSRTLDLLVSNSSTIRAQMLNKLQQNFGNADTFKVENVNRFYNSVTLMGEYYFRSRIGINPIKVLGKALLQVLTDHLRSELEHCDVNHQHIIDSQFAKLILTQISLNGQLAREHHKEEIEELLYQIRKCIIQAPTLLPNAKAMLLMSLDLYYSNFTNLGKSLEKLYAQYLVDEQDKKPIETNNKKTDGTYTKKISPTKPTSLINAVGSLNLTKNDISDTNMRVAGRGNGGKQTHVNREYIGRPLKASDRLKYLQKQSESAVHSKKAELDQEKLFEQEVSDTRMKQQQQQQQQHHQQQQQQQYQQQPQPYADTEEPHPDIIDELSRPLNHQTEVTQSTTPFQPQTSSPPTSLITTSNTPTTTRSSTKERRADLLPFSARPMSARSRLKAATTQATPVAVSTPTDKEEQLTPQDDFMPYPLSPPECSDWYAEVMSNGHNSPPISPTSLNITASVTSPATAQSSRPSTPQSSYGGRDSGRYNSQQRYRGGGGGGANNNHYNRNNNQQRYQYGGSSNNLDRTSINGSRNHLNTTSPSNRSNQSSNPVSPNEIQRNNYRNHSFRSNKSDRSTQSVDRNIDSKFEFKIFHNRRNQYRQNGANNIGDSRSSLNQYGTWGGSRGNRQYRGESSGGGGGGSEYAESDSGCNVQNNTFNNRKNSNGRYGRNNNYNQQEYENNSYDKNTKNQNNRYQRQQSIESESGVQKHFNNNRQFQNSNRLRNGIGGGGGGGSVEQNYNNNFRSNQTGRDNISRHGNASFDNSANQQNSNRSASVTSFKHEEDDFHLMAPLTSTQNPQTAEYSQMFLEYLAN